ncbi:MAG: NFACT family protein [Clostridiales Family XIII bacterium]|jgi:predicted ribosome quality control (RQC) complex YloA/Tae2 family protein|nr:NFACT family protein [Clostridiales Family XIII bacterium]
MPFDNFVTGAMARELDLSLAGGKVERIYQPDRYGIILHINVPPGAGNGDETKAAQGTDGEVPGIVARRRCDLFVSAQGSQPLIYLSSRKQGNPQTPPAFCMLLRKYLIGARIYRVFRVRHERIIRIEFDATDELGLHSRRTLLFEIMGKHSNIVLLDDGDRIMDAIKRVYADMSRVRQMLPGMAYTPPPPGRGIGPLMEEESRIGRPLDYYEHLDAEGRYEPLIFTGDDGRVKDYYVFGISLYDGLGRVRCPSVSAMLESFYEEKESGGRMEQKRSDLRQILKGRIDKLYLKKQRLLEDMEKAKRADEYRVKGELITANIYRLTQGAKEAELERFEAAVPARDTAGGPPTADRGTNTVRVTLDPTLTPAQNAQRYFKKYAKAKTAIIEKSNQLDITNRDIDFLESYKVFIENADDDVDIDGLKEELTALGYVRVRGKPASKKIARKKEYMRYESSSGLTIYVGRNNRENDELTLHKAKPDDLWLHTKDIPGSHVILVRPTSATPRAKDKHANTGDLPSGFDEGSVREAAMIAAWYSKAKQSESVPVDYCLVRYVKKPSGAKPGIVIFTHNRTLYVTPRRPGA